MGENPDCLLLSGIMAAMLNRPVIYMRMLFIFLLGFTPFSISFQSGLFLVIFLVRRELPGGMYVFLV